MAGLQPPNQAFLEQGAVFEEKYRIVRELGRGGFGMVYLAYQQQMDRHVAIKVLKSGIGQLHSSAKERFLREVKIISKLRHPNTVTIHDFGESTESILYMVLEYIEGKTFKEVLKHQGAQPPQRALALSSQISRSLAEAHRHGVVHRDLKPANIMVTDLQTESDFVKVLDFGIARLLRTDERDLTSAGLPDGERELIGTPRYMSPEQVRGESLGPASDVYSVGLILYEMLVGQPAVQGDTTMALISQQISSEPLKLAGLRGLAPSIGQVIRRATAKSLAQRFANAETFGDAIDQTLARIGGPPPGSATARQSGGFNAVSRAAPQSSSDDPSSGHATKDASGSARREANSAAADPAMHGEQPSATGRQRQKPSSRAPQQTPSGSAPSSLITRNDDRSPPQTSADRQQPALGTDLPPPPTDDNPFAVPDPTPTPGRQHSADHAEADPPTADFLVVFLKLTVFGAVAAAGLYMTFLTVSTIFGQFLSGNLKLVAAAVLAAAIPVLTALGENSKRERFEVVENPYDRIVRVFVGTAIFSFGAAVICALAMAGTVVHELRTFPNWFLPETQRQTALGNFNAQVSLGLAQVVEDSTTAIGIYDGRIHTDSGPIPPGAPPINQPPAPTRPSTRAKQHQRAKRDQHQPAGSSASDSAGRPNQSPPETDQPTSNDDHSTTDDGEYIRW